MDTKEEYLNFIKNNNFQGLLKFTNEQLLKDKNNKTALEYKAKSLLSLGSYNDAYNIFSSLLYANNDLYEFTNISKALQNFENAYKHYSNIKFDNKWLEKILLEQIKKAEQEFLNHNTSYTKKDFAAVKKYYNYYQSQASIDLHKYLSNQFHDVFLLGSKDVVDNFDENSGGDLHYEFDSFLQYPFSQAHRNGILYTKEQNYKLAFEYPFEDAYMVFDEFDYVGDDEEEKFKIGPLFIAPYPVIDWYLDLKSIQMKHPGADVYYSNTIVSPCLHRMVCTNLDNLAVNNKDYFVPMYHNIIDPNMTAIQQNCEYKWTATDFIVEENNVKRFNTMTSLQLSLKRLGRRLSKNILTGIKFCLINKKIPRAHIASPISNLPLEQNKELYVLAEEIFNIALPILSKITRPALLLPGKLQAVVKAQRIYLKPGEEYEGVWHRDGKYEDIVAVVIYYYRVSKQLIGGDLEFIDKQPIKDRIWFDGGSEEVTIADAKAHVNNIPYCRIPVKTGTLVVFSNYQMVHRVLKMTCNGVDINSPDGWASRDFLLFFVVDQSNPLASTKGDLSVKENRLKIRSKMFKEQIKPTGMFVPDTDFACATGNGNVIQIGWLNEAENYDFDLDLYECE
jgi:hypothetical protein